MPRKPKDTIPPALRWEVWERDNFTCHYCGERKPLSIDHKIPESRGGKTKLENLITSCTRCNREKGAMSYERYLLKREILWAIDYRMETVGSCSSSDEDMWDLYCLAKTRLLLKSAPDLFAPMVRRDPETGVTTEDWIIFRSATAEQFAELIEDRRWRGQLAEAEKYAMIARERLGESA